MKLSSAWVEMKNDSGTRQWKHFKFMFVWEESELHETFSSLFWKYEIKRAAGTSQTVIKLFEAFNFRLERKAGILPEHEKL